MLPAFCIAQQSRVAQKQVESLSDSLLIRQVYADTNTTDATRAWVIDNLPTGIVADNSGYGIPDASYSGWNTQGAISTNVQVKGGNYTVADNDHVIVAHGVYTWQLTLPSAAGFPNRILIVSQQMRVGIALALNTPVYFSGVDGTTVDYTDVLEQRKLYFLQSNGTQWLLLNPDEK